MLMHRPSSTRLVLRLLSVLLLLPVWGEPGLNAQLTIRIVEWPAFPPPYDKLYIAGNFNGWNPGNAAYELTLLQNNHYSITFDPPVGQLEFKFTRSNWETVESLANGGFRPNRTYTYDGNPKTLHLTVDGWADLSGIEHTAEPNVFVMDEDFYMPQLNDNRRIWICLPKDYETTAKRYPVLYMQDGQNLFDRALAFAGEWEIDESMNALFDMGDYGAIIVGIDNGGSARIDEYTPWAHPVYGGGDGELYAEFLAETLKPWVDTHYRTRPERTFTGVGGSSLGGLIALYTAVEHQDVFGKALVFSPSFWFSDSTFLHVQDRGVPADLRIIMAAGTSESAGMIPDMQAMYDLLIEVGASSAELLLQADPDGSHSETYWSRIYPDAYTWLFDQVVSAIAPHAPRIGQVFPNPSGDTVMLELSPGDLMRIEACTSFGQQVKPDLAPDGRLDVSDWTAGIYFVQVWYVDRTHPDLFRIVRR